MFGLLKDVRGQNRLDGKRIYLRAPRKGDQREWSVLRSESRDFLKPWEPTWPPNAMSRSAFRTRLMLMAADLKAKRSYSFFIFDRFSDALMGGITISNVRRGVAQNATIGYWIGRPYARQGFMAEAVQLILDFCFEILQLHRVEAACLPTNNPSRALLLGCGFKEEGLARQYLRINNQWQDHLTFGIIRSDIRPRRSNANGGIAEHPNLRSK